MKIGVQFYFGGQTATPELIAEAAQAAEQAGFHSIWAPEHVVLFKEHVSKYPYSQDGSFPVAAEIVPVDPFLTLTYIAAHTKRARLGTGIVIVPQRNPVYTAKQVADLDVLSNGRFDFGIGVGWLKEEFDALQVPFAHRGARADEYIEVMKTLWRETEASYEGRFYQLSKAVQGPKPVQTPHPPILAGGEADAALKRAARLDGWYAFDQTPETLKPMLEKLDRYLAEEGRKRSDIQVFVCPYTRGCDLDMIKGYRDLGVDQVIVFPLRLSPGEARRQVEELAEQYVAPAGAL